MKTSSNPKKFSAKRLALLAILTALCYVGRIIFQFLPNVQPMTAILLILTLNMGIMDGLLVATSSLFLSNLMLGMGPWTLTQLASFALVIFLTGFAMKPLYGKAPKAVFILFSFFVGLLYGFVISFLWVKMFGIANFWAYYLYGLPFDFAHAAGTAVFYIILEPILKPIFKKFQIN